MGEYIEYLRRHKEVRKPRKVDLEEKVVVKLTNVQRGEGILSLLYESNSREAGVEREFRYFSGRRLFQR